MDYLDNVTTSTTHCQEMNEPCLALLNSQVIGANALALVRQLLLILRTRQITLISTCTRVCLGEMIEDRSERSGESLRRMLLTCFGARNWVNRCICAHKLLNTYESYWWQLYVWNCSISNALQRHRWSCKILWILKIIRTELSLWPSRARCEGEPKRKLRQVWLILTIRSISFVRFMQGCSKE